MARDLVCLLDGLGDRWESNTGLCFAVILFYRMGDLVGVFEVVCDLHVCVVEVGGIYVQVWVLDVWVRVIGGAILVEFV